ncbi:hypothetical protein [Streptomyces eurocidicus]|uniref:Uncharacterized protein n=1 Tax=Streptomyces eurocidicus TaxID=66423 RepID=A0A7W8BCE4_STREU|nr:hypothetical protein [Streptomyces eurocidicus]MBB5119681.1 hypothetical protein [Streptomyces eurocidicus]
MTLHVPEDAVRRSRGSAHLERGAATARATERDGGQEDVTRPVR